MKLGDLWSSWFFLVAPMTEFSSQEPLGSKECLDLSIPNVTLVGSTPCTVRSLLFRFKNSRCHVMYIYSHIHGRQTKGCFIVHCNGGSVSFSIEIVPYLSWEDDERTASLQPTTISGDSIWLGLEVEAFCIGQRFSFQWTILFSERLRNLRECCPQLTNAIVSWDYTCQFLLETIVWKHKGSEM